MTDLETPDTRGSVEMSASRQRHCSCTLERQRLQETALSGGNSTESGKAVGGSRSDSSGDIIDSGRDWQSAAVISTVGESGSDRGETGGGSTAVMGLIIGMSSGRHH